MKVFVRPAKKRIAGDFMTLKIRNTSLPGSPHIKPEGETVTFDAFMRARIDQGDLICPAVEAKKAAKRAARARAEAERASDEFSRKDALARADKADAEAKLADAEAKRAERKTAPESPASMSEPRPADAPAEAITTSASASGGGKKGGK